MSIPTENSNLIHMNYMPEYQWFFNLIDLVIPVSPLYYITTKFFLTSINSA